MEPHRLLSNDTSFSLTAGSLPTGSKLHGHQSARPIPDGSYASSSSCAIGGNNPGYPVYIEPYFDMSTCRSLNMLRNEGGHTAGMTTMTHPSAGYDDNPGFVSGNGPDSQLITTALLQTSAPEQGAGAAKPPRKRRKAKPETWKKNVRKVLRRQGKAYVSETGKSVAAKQPRDVDCSNCRLRCNRLQDKRQELFSSFYSLATHEEQKRFVCLHVHEKSTKTYLNDSNEPCAKRRNVSREYAFTIEGLKEPVCKKFFLSTLRISSSYVDHAKKHSHNGLYVGSDGHKGKVPHNKTPESVTARVKEHISSFPVMLPHHSQSETQREYLPSDLNKKKMYRLYTQQCEEEGIKPVSLRQYKKIFKEVFNFSFHAPMRDQCSVCIRHSKKQTQGYEDEEEEALWQEHMRKKEKVYQEKETDKQAASMDPMKHVATVDLQAVLPVPCGLDSQFYDKRKLFVYNCTVFSLVDGKGTCYVWDETEGMQGSCEIASCLFLYLSSLPSVIKEVIFYCEYSGEKNLNQSLIAALLHAAKSVPDIEIITLKYFEMGHTQTECDTMHAAISFAKQHAPIYTPGGWCVALGMSRKGKKFTFKVVPMKHTSFYDFKKVAASYIFYTYTDIRRRLIDWLQVRCIQVLKYQEDLLLFKTSLEESEFRVLRLTECAARNPPPVLQTLPSLHSSTLPISMAKKQDLLSLCYEGIIPEEHHAFFRDLPAHPSACDRLPQPDRNEPAESDNE